MSYIRCLSGPEGMYVYWHIDGHIDLSGKGCLCLKVPPKDFLKACRAYEEKRLESFKSGDFSYREMIVDDKTGLPLTRKQQKQIETIELLDAGMADVQSDRRTKLGFRYGLFWKGRLKFSLWKVTWAYIARAGAKEKHS